MSKCGMWKVDVDVDGGWWMVDFKVRCRCGLSMWWWIRRTRQVEVAGSGTLKDSESVISDKAAEQQKSGGPRSEAEE
jgi:hypothetical protein